MQPATLDLALTIGDDALITFAFASAGAAVDLTDSALSLQVGWRGGGFVATKGAGLIVSGGQVQWALTPDLSAQLPAGRVSRWSLYRTRLDLANGLLQRRTYLTGMITGLDAGGGDQTIPLTINQQPLTVSLNLDLSGGTGSSDVDLSTSQGTAAALASGLI